MTTLNDPVASDQLRVTVEMGGDYTPSARVAAALHELSEALEADDKDVEGFYLKYELKNLSFSYDSLKLDATKAAGNFKVEIEGVSRP